MGLNKCRLLIGVCGIVVFSSVPVRAQSPTDGNSNTDRGSSSTQAPVEKYNLVMPRDLDTELAEAKVQSAASEYETARKLYSRGANSQQAVKRALYSLQVSKLELRRAKINASPLAEGEKKKQLALLQRDLARLEFENAFANYELTKRLYQKSSVSKQQLLYAHYLAKIAKLDISIAELELSGKSEIEKHFGLIDLVLEKARAKNRFLETVHETNQALFEKGRISRQEFLRSQQALEKSSLELEAAKAAANSHVET
jgi:multidrug resistance efflux pump